MRFRLLAVSFLASALGLAQVTTAIITGTALDPSRSVVPRATVRLANEQTGRSRNGVTGDAGTFRFEFLELGVYTLEVEAAGFKIEKRTGIRLDQSGKVIVQDIQLSVGTQAESVTVTGESPLLATAVSEQR
jgi:hypothetical protein